MLVQNKGKMTHLLQQGPLLEISYIALLSDTVTPPSYLCHTFTFLNTAEDVL